MQKIRSWSHWCLIGVAGLACSASAHAQQNTRLMDPSAAPSAQTGTAASAPAPKPLQIRVPKRVPVTASAPVLTPAPAPAVPVPVADPAATQPVASGVTPATAVPVQQKGVAVWWDITPVGETTRDLMAAQAAGAQASTESLPTLGATASRSWDRYLESFNHPVPEWFQERVEADE